MLDSLETWNKREQSNLFKRKLFPFIRFKGCSKVCIAERAEGLHQLVAEGFLAFFERKTIELALESLCDDPVCEVLGTPSAYP